ncbi:MAG TPA: hypothetical protein DEP66_05900 [Acidimicrobiaceae bacterium]|nr:hypothetical protein [Acidimicrobiaceae bacterium]
MAKRKPPNKTARYTHDSASRKNLATGASESAMTDEERKPRDFIPLVRTRSDEPVLAWERKRGDSNGTQPPIHDAHPLFVREKVSPADFVDSLKSTSDNGQGELLGERFNGYPDEDSQYQWYQHDINWNNRLIHGESAEVMSSLSEREDFTGEVQMIYFDPPYGISYKSNFQVDADQIGTENKREHIPLDPLTVTAFRDTYERGIHSYLDEMHEKLTLCRSLLHETGSIFVQIGNENVLRMGLLCDEVFGPENRVSLITYATTGGGSSKTLPSASTYLLWYAKDRSQVKYRRIYEAHDRKSLVDAWTFAARVELEDGETRALTKEEQQDPESNLSEDCVLCHWTPLVSQGWSNTGRSEPYTWNGRVFQCSPTSHWAVSMKGLDRLAELGRLDASKSATTLRWKWYENEVPGRRINNIWPAVASTSDKRYVVQTDDSIPTRCLLMTTDPGDLVFDPTCGSGTTAMVAERWGRRWITCDTSLIAIAVARQRLTTSTYDYWTLNGTPDGIAAEQEYAAAAGVPSDQTEDGEAGAAATTDPAVGFVCERVRHVSAGRLAYDEPPEYTMLVDKPHPTPGVVRLSSPFTIESTSRIFYKPLDGNAEMADTSATAHHFRFVDRIVEALRTNRVRFGLGGEADLTLTPAEPSDESAQAALRVVEVVPWPGSQITHRLTVSAGGSERRAGLLIAPPDTAANAHAIRRAAEDTHDLIAGATQLFVIAYEFEPETAALPHVGPVEVLRVLPHRDLMIEELDSKKEHHGFVLLGSPDLEVRGVTADGAEVRLDGDDDPAESPVALVVEVLGFDTYDPSTGNAGVVEAAQGEKTINAAIKCWMIDTEFDGLNFFARRVHFPGSERDKLVRDLKKSLGRGLDKAAWDAMQSNRSAPFPLPKTGRIAVKVITSTGMEMTVTRDCPSG